MTKLGSRSINIATGPVVPIRMRLVILIVASLERDVGIEHDRRRDFTIGKSVSTIAVRAAFLSGTGSVGRDAWCKHEADIISTYAFIR